MIISSSINSCAKNVVQITGRVQGHMGGNICGVTFRGSSNSFCFHLYNKQPKRSYSSLSVSQTSCCPSIKPRCNVPTQATKNFMSTRGSHKRCVQISLMCQSINMKLLVPKLGAITKIECNAGPVNWPCGCASASLIFGLLVCHSTGKPVHAEGPHENKDKEDDCDSLYTKYAHGKKVYTDYSVTGEL